MDFEIGVPKVVTFGFGSNKAGLGTVGYQLYNANGTTNGPRVTTGVVEVGHGSYQTTLTFNAAFNGSLIADTGEGSPLYTDALGIVAALNLWDQPFIDHNDAGSMGQLLGAAGVANDPLLNPVPGAYAPGTAGAALGRIGPARVTFLAPVVQNGSIRLIKGDDYTSDRALQFTDENGNWPSLAPGGTTASLFIGGNTYAGVITNAGASDQTITFAITSAQSALITDDTYNYALEVLVGGTAPVTLVRGQATVVERVPA